MTQATNASASPPGPPLTPVGPTATPAPATPPPAGPATSPTATAPTTAPTTAPATPALPADQLTLAGLPPGPAPSAGDRPTYVVKPGDILSAIAQQQLGDVSRWPELFQLNEAQLQNPNWVRPGMKLVLPKPGEQVPLDAWTRRVAALSDEQHQKLQQAEQLLGSGNTLTLEDRNAAPPTDPQQLQAAEQALSPAQQAQLAKVRGIIASGSSGPEARLLDITTDPKAVARDQLAALVASGQATSVDSQGHSLLDDLAAMGDAKVAGVAPDALIEETLKDVTHPSTIAQGEHDTCTAASIQSQLAAEQPAEYARLVAGLASGQPVTLQDGKSTLAADHFQDDPDRTVTANLFQEAVMGLEAAAEGGTYDPSKDRITTPQDTHGGASATDVSAVQSAITGTAHSSFDVDPTSPQAGQILDVFKPATPRKPVLATLDLPGLGMHEVGVIGYDPARGTLQVRNPWGVEDTMTVAAFQKVFRSISYAGAAGG